jgi:ubiquinol-cytochrome c reductase cytochrome c subunit
MRPRPGRHRLAATLLAAVSVGVVMEAVGSVARGQVQEPTSRWARGRALFQRDCAWCHGTTGEGTNLGPTLIGSGAASAHFVLTTGRMPIAEPEVQPDRAEPSYGPEETDALVVFVGSLGGGPPVPAVNPDDGDLSEGAVLYERNCAACHGSTGVGGALTSGLIAPAVDRATAVQIAEAVRIGGSGVLTGDMPRFGSETLDQEQLDAVVRYTLALGDPENPGGASITHLGPVAEGFVAVFGGLLLLAVIIRRLGRRAGEGGG